MSKVQRWRADWAPMESDTGAWVLFKDYAALEAENEKLLGELKDARIADEQNGQDYVTMMRKATRLEAELGTLREGFGAPNNATAEDMVEARRQELALAANTSKRLRAELAEAREPYTADEFNELVACGSIGAEASVRVQMRSRDIFNIRSALRALAGLNPEGIEIAVALLRRIEKAHNAAGLEVDIPDERGGEELSDALCEVGEALTALGVTDD